ncbi:MAG: gamma-glutamylcyclotransferase [Gammaproteobacteria bacterium]|nr:gamma-glutamylcyclotransferase [Gammaproteobacteria bacterium]MDH3534564.1 gamma-glutamylcyclotransferase [Gammaproteobacteria bacterium]
MLRYLVWRLLFEACNIRRLLGHGSETVQYLAFGANLSDAVMRKRRITPLAMRHFTLRDYGLRFDHPAPWAGCGYASAEYAPGESVHGFLYTLSARDAARMDFYEVVPVVNRYRRTWVDQDGETVYFYQTNRSTPNLKPTAEYLGYIVNGLETHPDASDEYRAAMVATVTGVPGIMVSSYLWEQPESRRGWRRAAIGIYQKMALVVFLKVIYRYSLTAWIIRV